MREFTDDERDGIVTDFDAVQAAAGFACERAGTDVWTAGGPDDAAGDRELRAPLPTASTGSALAER